VRRVQPHWHALQNQTDQLNEALEGSSCFRFSRAPSLPFFSHFAGQQAPLLRTCLLRRFTNTGLF